MKDVATAKMLNTVRHMRVMTENDFGTLHYRLFFEFHQPLCRPIAVLIAAMNAQDDHVHGSRRFPKSRKQFACIRGCDKIVPPVFKIHQIRHCKERESNSVFLKHQRLVERTRRLHGADVGNIFIVQMVQRFEQCAFPVIKRVIVGGRNMCEPEFHKRLGAIWRARENQIVNRVLSDSLLIRKLAFEVPKDDIVRIIPERDFLKREINFSAQNFLTNHSSKIHIANRQQRYCAKLGRLCLCGTGAQTQIPRGDKTKHHNNGTATCPNKKCSDTTSYPQHGLTSDGKK